MSKTDKEFLSRRSLIRGALYAGAALGLARWKVYEVLEDTVGTAIAADAACHPTNRSVHIVAGTGESSGSMNSLDRSLTSRVPWFSASASASTVSFMRWI